MRFDIDKPVVLALVTEEVSRVADESYSDSGESLYDSVILTSRDADTVERFLTDAFQELARRTFDICERFSLGEESWIDFYVPDFDEDYKDAVENELERHLALQVCVSVFKSRRASAVPEYTERAAKAADKAVTLLKSRKTPIKIW